MSSKGEGIIHYCRFHSCAVHRMETLLYTPLYSNDNNLTNSCSLCTLVSPLSITDGECIMILFPGANRLSFLRLTHTAPTAVLLLCTQLIFISSSQTVSAIVSFPLSFYLPLFYLQMTYAPRTCCALGTLIFSIIGCEFYHIISLRSSLFIICRLTHRTIYFVVHAHLLIAIAACECASYYLLDLNSLYLQVDSSFN